MSAPNSSNIPNILNTPQGAPPADLAPPALCGECGLLYASDQMLDFCDQCGAPRCRACASRANDDEGGVYICSTCADALDAAGAPDALDTF